MKKLYLYCVLLILIQWSLTISAEQGVKHHYLGPYKQVYPFIDITQDQKICSVTENGTCPLYIALMVSFGGEFDSSGVIPGVQMALDQINSNPAMLPGYTLHYTLTATRVLKL